MTIIPSKSLTEIATDTSYARNRLKSLPLEEALARKKYLWKRTAYHVGSYRDVVLFGLDDTACLINIPSEIYEAIGSPEGDKVIPVSIILEKAGYKQ
jgi:hypothetical protein